MRAFDLAAIAPAHRRAALRAQVLAWAPFDDTEARVELHGAAAWAYAWDRTRVAAMLASADDTGAHVEPEQAFRAAPSRDGPQLVECLEGVEAQYWRGGALHASRWWSALPDADEQRAWQRSLGPLVEGQGHLPVPARTHWRTRPHSSAFALDHLQSTTSRLERIAFASACVVLAGLGAVQARQLHEASRRHDDAQAQLERARADAGPTLALRDRALAQAAQAQVLADAVTGVSPLDLLNHLAEVLPASGVTLKELELQGKRLRLALELAPQVARSSIVRELQAGGWLTQVAERSDGGSQGWTRLEMELQGVQAPLVARAASAAAAPATRP